MPMQTTLKAIITIGLIVLFFFPIVEKYNHIDNRIYKTCQYVYDRIIPVGKDLNEWMYSCRIQSRLTVSQTNNLKMQLKKANDILSELNVSHLELFDQKESEAIWKDTNLENGIESQFMDGELIITRVLPGGDALKKGLQRGDRVVLGSDESLSPYELNEWKGKLKVERRKNILTVDLEPHTLTVNRDVKISDVNGVKVITVESFKSQYFHRQALEATFSKIKRSDKVIIDLRDNKGGNFVAGLRLLSQFICEPTLVGYMKKNRDLGKIGYFKDELDDEYQIDVLSKHDSIALTTFTPNRCLPKPSAILLDAGSKSTTEWVALAFRDFLQVPIRGSTSAGELLVAEWTDVSFIWGAMIRVSIPEAYYESVSGYQIEGQGVRADTILYPRRADFERGFDSGVWQAVQILSGTL